ncbi:hypothetical protein [Plantactinospora endophytica]|uniref:DUF3618 domain-containing protein n=1 Tax=Plantactinospora endophytica TaxID=673535 RepID=A0ABQ4DW09_9ACTN|nr:hypothetical protein [Plantactinospora endophytica]GIG86635.1 hypothetical protein Pen02_15710 [Plantactinospora endophytica]
MADVVAQLLDLRKRLAASAVTAMRANAHAEQSQRHYHEAAQGTERTQLEEAITDIQTAGEKSARIARLLDKARKHFEDYLDTIAPGSIPDHDVVDGAMPSGERVLGESEQRSDSAPGVGAFMRRMSRNVESLQDAGKSATEVAQTTIKILKGPLKPPGTQCTSTAKPPPSSSPAQQKIDAPEAAGHLVAIGVIVSVTMYRSSQLIRKGIARFRARGHEKRTERPDPGDGPT